MRMTRTLFLALLCTSAAPAFAADVSYAPTVYDWSGFYAGVHAGYGALDVSGIYDGNAGDDFILDNQGNFSLSGDGFVGGVQAGYNWQMDALVLGLEGDFSFADFSDSLGPNGDNESVQMDANMIATLRARAGYAMDNLLIYGTAGAAWTDADYSNCNNAPACTQTASASFDGIGLVVGGGAEWAFAQQWSFRAEGLYLYFNDRQNNIVNPGDGGTANDFATLDDGWIVRAALNYHF